MQKLIKTKGEMSGRAILILENLGRVDALSLITRQIALPPGRRLKMLTNNLIDYLPLKERHIREPRRLEESNLTLPIQFKELAEVRDPLLKGTTRDYPRPVGLQSGISTRTESAQTRHE